MTRHAPTAVREAAQRLRAAGVPLRTIGKQLGYDESTIRAWTRKPAETHTDYLMSEVLFLREQGEHPEMIAQVLGVDRESLLRSAKRHGRADVIRALTLDYQYERAWRGCTFHNDRKTA